jgi:hypothetical protein
MVRGTRDSPWRSVARSLNAESRASAPPPRRAITRMHACVAPAASHLSCTHETTALPLPARAPGGHGLIRAALALGSRHAQARKMRTGGWSLGVREPTCRHAWGAARCSRHRLPARKRKRARFSAPNSGATWGKRALSNSKRVLAGWPVGRTVGSDPARTLLCAAARRLTSRDTWIVVRAQASPAVCARSPWGTLQPATTTGVA